MLVQRKFFCKTFLHGEGEGEVAFFSAKRWDRRNRADLIESATPCHDAQVVGPYRDSNPLRLTVLAAMSEDYTTAPQHQSHNNTTPCMDSVAKYYICRRCSAKQKAKISTAAILCKPLDCLWYCSCCLFIERVQMKCKTMRIALKPLLPNQKQI